MGCDDLLMPVGRDEEVRTYTQLVKLACRAKNMQKLMRLANRGDENAGGFCSQGRAQKPYRFSA